MDENIRFTISVMFFQLNSVQMMSSDSITYTSSEAIWGESVGFSVVLITSGLIGKFRSRITGYHFWLL